MLYELLFDNELEIFNLNFGKHYSFGRFLKQMSLAHINNTLLLKCIVATFLKHYFCSILPLVEAIF